MSKLRAPFSGRRSGSVGGILGYPLGALHEEVAFLAYYLHWPLDDILALEHADRRDWVTRVSELNRLVSEGER